MYLSTQHFQRAGNALLTRAVPHSSSRSQIELVGGRRTVPCRVRRRRRDQPPLFDAHDGPDVPLAIVSSWTPIDERQNQFYGLMLFMEANLLGVFTALDFFLWFVFWEGVLIPMYFLIGVWGGPRRKYAAIKFFVYTNVASLIMFVGFLSPRLRTGRRDPTLGLPAIAQALRGGAELGSLFGFPLATVAFVLMFFGFAVKVPVFPVHTWLPDAHVEAPTPVSVMLAGVLLKMGTYALLRFNFTMLSDVAISLAPYIGAIGVLSVIYGAMLALAQRDLKRIVAYSSISSMGYVILRSDRVHAPRRRRRDVPDDIPRPHLRADVHGRRCHLQRDAHAHDRRHVWPG